jgi:hypothetical protein
LRLRAQTSQPSLKLFDSLRAKSRLELDCGEHARGRRLFHQPKKRLSVAPSDRKLPLGDLHLTGEPLADRRIAEPSHRDGDLLGLAVGLDERLKNAIFCRGVTLGGFGCAVRVRGGLRLRAGPLRRLIGDCFGSRDARLHFGFCVVEALPIYCRLIFESRFVCDFFSHRQSSFFGGRFSRWRSKRVVRLRS